MKKSSERIISSLIITLGAILTVYGLVLCINLNLNLGVVLVVMLGAFTLVVGIFYKRIKKLTEKGFFRGLKIVIIILLCIELALVSFIAIYGICDNVDYTEDSVIVLGAGVRGDKVTLLLKMRLDRAVEFHQKNPDAFIVVSGGQGFQETVTEAYAMEKYLIEQGVDKNKIIKEEKAVSTYENMKFSKEILDEKIGGDYRIVVITNNFHIFRGTSIAKKAGFENVSHMHASLQWYNLMPCFLRESLAVLKMLILG